MAISTASFLFLAHCATKTEPFPFMKELIRLLRRQEYGTGITNLIVALSTPPATEKWLYTANSPVTKQAGLNLTRYASAVFAARMKKKVFLMPILPPFLKN